MLVCLEACRCSGGAPIGATGLMPLHLWKWGQTSSLDVRFWILAQFLPPIFFVWCHLTIPSILLPLYCDARQHCSLWYRGVLDPKMYLHWREIIFELRLKMGGKVKGMEGGGVLVSPHFFTYSAATVWCRYRSSFNIVSKLFNFVYTAVRKLMVMHW